MSTASSPTSAVRPPGSWGVALELADGAVEFADLLAELEALRGQVLPVESALGFHPGDVVLDAGQGGARVQRGIEPP
ncbi:MAG: hypothetical protein M3Y33_03315 [Actinomycetota bacterium]|nr:hypothetical protein [Actinomycetota bacterium]